MAWEDITPDGTWEDVTPLSPKQTTTPGLTEDTAGIMQSAKAAYVEPVPFVGERLSEEVLGGKKSWFEPKERGGESKFEPDLPTIQGDFGPIDLESVRMARQAATESLQESPKRIAKALVQTPVNALVAGGVMKTPLGKMGPVGTAAGFSMLGAGSKTIQEPKPAGEGFGETMERFGKNVAVESALNVPFLLPSAVRAAKARVMQPTEGMRPPEIPRSAPEIPPESIKVPDIQTLAKGGPTTAAVENVNLTKIGAPEDVLGMLQKMAEENKGVLLKAKRGKMKIEDIRKKAAASGITLDDITARKMGDTYNAEQMDAVNSLATQAAQNAHMEVVSAVKAGTPEAMNAARQNLSKTFAVFAQAEGAKSEAARTMRMLREQSDPNLMRSVFKKLGDPSKFSDEVMRGLAAIDPTDVDAIRAFIKEAAKAGPGQKLYELWINFILSGPKTHAANTISNTITAISVPLERGAAAAADVLMGAFGAKGPRGRFFGEASHEAKGQALGIMAGLKDGVTAFKTELPQFGTQKVEQMIIPAWKGSFGRTVRLPGRFLMAEDELFKTINYRGTLYSGAYRRAASEKLSGKEMSARIAELVRNPPEDLAQEARRAAVERTFQEKLGKYGSAVAGFRTLPGIRYVLPFVRTPWNIAKYGIERTPLVGIKLAKNWTKMDRGERADELGRLMLSGAMTGAVAALVAEGKITGGGPKNPAERRTWMQTGRGPYTIRIGDRWVGYGRAEPLGMTVGLVADFVENAQETGAEDAPVTILTSVARNVLSKTFMSGLSNMFKAIQDPDRYGKNWSQRIVGSVIPNLAATFTRAEDPTIYRPDTMGDVLRSRIPLIDKSGIPKVRDIYGKPVRPAGGPISEMVGAPTDSVVSVVERFLSPIEVRPHETDAATKELFKHRIGPGYLRKEIGGIKLSAMEFDRYVELAGEEAKRLLTGMVGNPSYQNRPDERKEEMLQDKLALAAKRARNRILREIPERRRRKAEAREMGLQAPRAYE